jgi:hypothetical protein
MTTKFGVELDFETADRILVCALKEHYEYIKKENDDYDDQEQKLSESQSVFYVENVRTAKAMKLVLEYFGEKL